MIIKSYVRTSDLHLLHKQQNRSHIYIPSIKPLKKKHIKHGENT